MWYQWYIILEEKKNLLLVIKEWPYTQTEICETLHYNIGAVNIPLFSKTCFYLKGRFRESCFYVLVHSFMARAELIRSQRTGASFGSPTWVQKPSTWAFLQLSQGINRQVGQSGVTWTVFCTHMSYWHRSWRLGLLLCHGDNS